MNPQVPNELLSAYFDGEASPEERAAVESLLDESTASRRELDEISQLSALLHSFPRESAPAELVANVQRATDQKPLAAKAVIAPIVSARSLRREWTAAVLASVATAAALMLMVNLADRTGSRSTAVPTRNEVALATAERQLDRDHLALAFPHFNELDESGNRPLMAKSVGVNDGLAALLADAPSPAVAAKKSGGPNEALVTAPMFAGEPSFGVQQLGNGIATNSLVMDNSVILNNGDFLNGLKVGQVYTFVPQVADPENNVAVVDLEVLDIERGADQVQVLLSRHSIKPRLAGQANDRGKQNFEKLREQSKGGSNELVVVYSYGPGEQVAKTLEDMTQHPDLFLSWSAQPPVQLPIGELSVDENSEGTTAKDKSNSADSVAAGKPIAARRKEAVSDVDMDGEAELALNALIARNNYSNANSFALPDSPTNNFAKEQAGGIKPPEFRAATPNAPQARAMPSKSNAASDQKADPAAKKALAQRSAYQQTMRVANDAPHVNEPTLPLPRSQRQNVEQGINTTRRYTANLGLPQAAMNTNGQVDANQAVKVLFVLHAAQAPAAAPAGKPVP